MGSVRALVLFVCLTPVSAAQTSNPASHGSWQERIDLEQPPVFRAVEGSQPPPGYEREIRIDGRQFARGFAYFAPGYALTTFIGMAEDGNPLGLIPCAGAWLPHEELNPFAGLFALFACAYQLVGGIEMGVALSEATPVYVRQPLALQPGVMWGESRVILDYSFTF